MTPAQPQMLQVVPSPAWSNPWAPFPSEVLLLQHGHTHGQRCFEASYFHMDTSTDYRKQKAALNENQTNLQ